MNYRHAFHAGNFADVVKHLVLTRILAYLARKPAPFRVLDTHAGLGFYDLFGPAAERTGEWLGGIARLLETGLPPEAAALAAPYLEAVKAQNPDGVLRYYPGSPAIARHMLRPKDRLTALELHPEDADSLKANFSGDFQTRITCLDGWAAMGTHLPPKEKRGLVLVDPPFEDGQDFHRMVASLSKAHKRWPGGVYAYWYPLKDREAVPAYIAALKATDIGKILRLELTISPPATPPRLYGAGMIVVNPPYVLVQDMNVLLPALADLLAVEGPGGWRIEWVAGE